MRKVLGCRRGTHVSAYAENGSLRTLLHAARLYKIVRLKCLSYVLGTFLLPALIRTTKIRLSLSFFLFFQQVTALEMMTLEKLMCCWVTFKRLRVL